MDDERIDFAIQNDVAIEFLSDLVEHLKQTGNPLQISSGLGAVDIGVEGCICLSFMNSYEHEYGNSIAIDRQPEAPDANL